MSDSDAYDRDESSILDVEYVDTRVRASRRLCHRVPSCGNIGGGGGGDDACPKIPGPQPFPKHSLPKIEGQRCSRPLAAVPAMSLLWLRPGAGGPKHARGGAGKNKKERERESEIGGAEGEDAVDPAVRSWATAGASIHTHDVLARLEAQPR